MGAVKGLPIAAYLAMLVALALAAAFVAVLAIVIWLPPRPPDVMPADVVAELFADGYQHMREEGRTLPDSGMAWSVRPAAPPGDGGQRIEAAQLMLAEALDLTPDRVRVSAQHVRRNDVFVFQVRDLDEIRRRAAEAAREALHETMIEARETEHEVREAEAAVRDAEAVVRDMERESARDRATAAEMLQEAQNDLEEARQAREDARAAHRSAAAALARVREHADRAMVVESHTRTFEFRVGDASAPPAAGSVPGAPAAPSPPIPPRPPLFAPAPRGVALISGFQVSAQLPDGRWLVMRQGRNWAEIGWIGRAALIIAGALTVLSVLALLFARRLTRPIRSFSDAVQAVGVNPQSEPVAEEGPSELRSAARAVNAMQARLRALIADRTKTLAAVAHDMRTPLMRLRLAAESAAPEPRERMTKEIGEVEALVASFIAFARDDPAEEARVRLDLSALLQSIADDEAEHDRNVSFACSERLIVTGQSLGLKRLFSNLVANALKYGAAARIKARREQNMVIVDIEDDGPGIPHDQRESVFEPFVRLGAEGGGAGLGLPTARSIARAHGGDVAILSADAGAIVRVTLPG
jgi:signal transduction histidine kinase